MFSIFFEWSLYIVIGTVSGFVAGLFGIGGGLVMVPVLVIFFQYKGFGDLSAHLAVATSLAVVVSNSLSATYNQYKRDCVDLKGYVLIPALIIGALMGAWFADIVSGYVLRIVLVCFLFVMSGYMLLAHNIQKIFLRVPFWIAQCLAIIIGCVSAIVGIAGGTFLVPLLSAMGKPIRIAVGTSSALGVPLSLIATIGYIVLGLHIENRPDWSIGYVYVPAFLGLFAMAPLGAKVGVGVGHSISPTKLRVAFSGLLFVSAGQILWNLLYGK